MKGYPSMLLLLVVSIATAQEEEIKQYLTERIPDDPPSIDGKLDEEVWDLVEWGGDFVQRQPEYGVQPSEQTQFKILYDAKNLYVGVRAWDSDPSAIVKRMSRRDGFEGDWVEINIDSYHDKRTAFSFTASVSGVKGDEYVSNNGSDWDETWDPIWYLATSIDDKGWIAEFRIPLSQLRFADKPEHTWGVQFTRRFFRKEERSTWQPIPQDAPGWVHLFGELKGIKGIRPQKQLEIQPYVVGKAERYNADDEDPFSTGKDDELDFGIDAKIGITSDITLDLTINPDFGQVEADPSRVNLSAFRLFFRERRPFFLEGNNVLSFPLVGFNRNNLFYSRQIGGPPSYYPDADYVDQPNQTRILGAAKITGKNKNGFSWGLLESVTNREQAEISIDGEKSKITVEPYTNYLVGRVQQDIKEGETVIGAMMTSTNRFINNEHLDFLHTEAQSGGIDIKHNINERKYGITFRSAFSRVHGSAGAITETQMASERYFQRPDNNHKDLDTTRTTLMGSSSTLLFEKQSGSWVWEIGGTYRSPGLDLNDIGFLVQTDNIMQWIWSQYRVLEPKSIFRWQRYSFIQWREYDFGKKKTSAGYEFNFRSQLKNYWFIGSGLTFEEDQLSNADLRGGPSIRYPGGTNWWYFIGTNDQKKIRLSFNQWFFWGMENFRYNTGISPNLTIRPTDALRISINPSISWNRNDLQYISETEDLGGNTRYILGRVEQRTYRLSARMNFNVTPNLTVEFWGQPFLSTGEYSHFKETLNPNSENYFDRYIEIDNNLISYNVNDELFEIRNANSDIEYTIDDPDFNVIQFRSNFVIRWEYIPGSTLFLVWSSNGSDFHNSDENNFKQLRSDLFDLNSRNTFLIKYTYRFIL